MPGWSWSRWQSWHSDWRRTRPPTATAPQHISGDSAASPRPSSRRRGGCSQPAASFQVLPPTTTIRAGGWAIVLQYRRNLLHASVVAIYTFLRSARRMRVGEAAITWTRAVISCWVNCCRRPVFKKNLVLTSLFSAVVLRPPQIPPPANFIFTTSTSATCRRWFADVPAGSDVADFRCPMCTSAEL